MMGEIFATLSYDRLLQAICRVYSFAGKQLWELPLKL